MDIFYLLVTFTLLLLIIFIQISIYEDVIVALSILAFWSISLLLFISSIYTLLELM